MAAVTDTDTLLTAASEDFTDSEVGFLEEENLPLGDDMQKRSRTSQRAALLVICFLAMFAALLGTQAWAKGTMTRSGLSPKAVISEWSGNEGLQVLTGPNNTVNDESDATTIMSHDPLSMSEVFDHCEVERNVDYWVHTKNNLAVLKVENREACARACLKRSILGGVTGNRSCRSWTWDRRVKGDAGYYAEENCYLKRNVQPGRRPHTKRDSGFFCAALFQGSFVPAPVARIGLTGLLAVAIGTLAIFGCLCWCCFC